MLCKLVEVILVLLWDVLEVVKEDVYVECFKVDGVDDVGSVAAVVGESSCTTFHVKPISLESIFP